MTNENRRRIAASTSAMDRSAVFMVPMMTMLRGNVNGGCAVHEVDASLRYSSRKYSSPKILARLPRLISSMMRTNGA